MTRQQSRRYHGQSSLLTALPVLMLLDFGIGTASAQQAAKPERNPGKRKPAGQEFALRGQRTARDIKYSDWRKVCFKDSRNELVCRTSISGTFETGQSAVRIGLIEREGDKAARLQMFPSGRPLSAGRRKDHDRPGRRLPVSLCLVPYQRLHCRRSGRPKLIKEMETGQRLLLEVVDTSMLTVSTTVPIDQFAAVRQGTPAQTFEQDIDE